jgi:chromosome segregation ATPase
MTDIEESEHLAAYKHVWRKWRKARKKLIVANRNINDLQVKSSKQYGEIRTLIAKVNELKADCMAKGLRIKELEEDTTLSPPYAYRDIHQAAVQASLALMEQINPQPEPGPIKVTPTGAPGPPQPYDKDLKRAPIDGRGSWDIL